MADTLEVQVPPSRVQAFHADPSQLYRLPRQQPGRQGQGCAQFTVLGGSTSQTATDNGPTLPLPLIGVGIAVVIIIGIGGQWWMQRQAKR